MPLPQPPTLRAAGHHRLVHHPLPASWPRAPRDHARWRIEHGRCPREHPRGGCPRCTAGCQLAPRGAGRAHSLDHPPRKLLLERSLADLLWLRQCHIDRAAVAQHLAWGTQTKKTDKKQTTRVRKSAPTASQPTAHRGCPCPTCRYFPTCLLPLTQDCLLAETCTPYSMLSYRILS